jgi:predicted nucleic acid-binding Zn ribbon protein
VPLQVTLASQLRANQRRQMQNNIASHPSAEVTNNPTAQLVG